VLLINICGAKRQLLLAVIRYATANKTMNEKNFIHNFTS
jgi:hypothetical protein